MVEEPTRINLVQGEYTVSKNPEVVVSTVLGSCVAACMYDSVTHVGGMNHFLLPGEIFGAHSSLHERGNMHLMEMLVIELLKKGASRQHLRAKLFGGANTVKGLGKIGTSNAIFAQEFLTNEGIAYVGGSLGGESVRRLQFWPFSGKAMQILVVTEDAKPPVSVPTDDFEIF